MAPARMSGSESGARETGVQRGFLEVGRDRGWQRHLEWKGHRWGREEKKKRRRSHAKGKCFKVLVGGQGTQKEVTGRGQSIEEVLGVMKRCQLLWPL